MPELWPDLCEAAAKAEADGTVSVTGLWSHFAFADGGPEHPVNNRQSAVFAQALEVAAGKGLQPEVRHLANSAAALTAANDQLSSAQSQAAEATMTSPIAGESPDATV